MIKLTKEIFFLFNFLIVFANSEITYKVTFYIPKFYEYLNTSLAIHMQSYAFPGNHFVGIGNDTTGNWSLIYISDSQFSYYRKNITGILFDEEIRSANFNNDYSTSRFLIFNKDRARLVGTGTFNQTIFEDPSITILDVCFGESSEIILVFIDDENYPNYQIVFIINSTILAFFDLQIPKTLEFDQFLYSNGTLLISLKTKIVILKFEMEDVVDMQIIDVPEVDITLMHMAIQESYIGFVVNDTFTILRSDTLEIYWTQQIVDIKMSGIALAYFKLFIMTENEILFYDLDIKKNVSRIAHGRNASKSSINYHSRANKIVLYSEFPEIAMNYQVYYIYASYPCSNCTSHSDCYSTYVLNKNKTMCIKEIEYIPEPDDPVEPVEPVEEPIVDDPEKEWVFGINPETMRAASQQMGKWTSLASLRIMPSFIFAFTVFLDDVWFYKFHRYDYPEQVQFVMQEVDIVNELRLGPGFLNFLDFFNPKGVSSDKNSQFSEYLGFNGNDPENIYFLNSAEETYKSNLIVNLLFFGLIRLLLFGLTKLNIFLEKQEENEQTRQSIETKTEEIANISLKETEKSTKIGKTDKKIEEFEEPQEKVSSMKKHLKTVVTKVRVILKEGSHWWSLLVAILEANMLKLTFNCFIQFLMPSSFSFSDKFNFVITVTCLFLLLTYCCCFYFFIFVYETKKYSQVLLSKTTYKFRSFLFEAIFVVSRNFARGVIHAFFIGNYKIQISFLSVTDLIFIVVAIKMWNCFEYKVIAVLSILYSMGFFAFDFFFCLKAILPEEKSHWNDEKIAMILVLILVMISLSTSLFFLLALIYETIKSLCKSNKRKIQSENFKSESSIKKKTYFEAEKIAIDIENKKENGGPNLHKWKVKKEIKEIKLKRALKVNVFNSFGHTDSKEVKIAKRHIKFNESLMV